MSPSGDQDKQFDELLGRHVRRSIRDDAPLDCPAADALAAYHDRSLSPEEMSFWKEHIASCNSCQEILTHLEATDDVPLREEILDHVQQEVAFAHPAAAPRAAVLRDELAEDRAAARTASQARAESPTAISRSRSSMPRETAPPRNTFRG